MKNRFAVLLTLAAIGALTVAGCGGSDDSSGDSEPPTKAEFITQADEICQNASDNLSEAQADLGADSTKDDFIAFIEETYLPELKDEVSQIKDLTPPADDEDAVNSLVTSLEDGVDAIESDPASLLEDGADPLAEATSQAEELGLKVCGQAGQSS